MTKKNTEMSDFWAMVNNVSFGKKDIWDYDSDKVWIPFQANRQFSYFPDTVMYANELNKYPGMPAKWNHDYFINSLRPAKRFAKRPKKQENDDIEAIKTYYGYNDVQSLAALSLLSTEQIEEIKTRIIKGGRE